MLPSRSSRKTTFRPPGRVAGTNVPVAVSSRSGRVMRWLTIQASTVVADPVHVGAFTLSSQQVDQLSEAAFTAGQKAKVYETVDAALRETFGVVFGMPASS